MLADQDTELTPEMLRPQQQPLVPLQLFQRRHCANLAVALLAAEVSWAYIERSASCLLFVVLVTYWEVLLISSIETHSSFGVNETQRGHPHYQWVSNVDINSVCAKQIGIKHVSYDDAWTCCYPTWSFPLSVDIILIYGIIDLWHGSKDGMRCLQYIPLARL